jgi:glycosyltransferase involved in cell wall biosynthesis
MFPVAIMEAMASALPVVSTRVGSVETLVLERETGLLILPDRPTEFAQCILFLLDSPKIARRMRQAAREHPLRDFTVERMVRDYQILSEQLMASEKTREDSPC